jgi:hypothetical protein
LKVLTAPPPHWTCKSRRRLATELTKLGQQIGHAVVGALLKQQKFSTQVRRPWLRTSR